MTGRSELSWTLGRPADGLEALLRCEDGVTLRGTAFVNSLSVIDLFWAGLLMFIVWAGASLQAYANGTTDAFLVAFLFLVAGAAAVSFAFGSRRAEVRAFLLTYAICVLVGGLAQCYSLSRFGDPQSTLDASTYFRPIRPEPPFTTMADVQGKIDATLAIVIWQQVYRLMWVLDLDFGSYAAVIFNAMVMGLTASITVRIAREVFGDDGWRLRRVGTLFACCGLFILFGAVLLRDCLTTFLNTLVVLGLVHWLCRPTVQNLSLALAMTAVSAYAMVYLRIEAIAMFAVFWVIGIVLWFRGGRLNPVRLLAVCLIFLVALAAGSYLYHYIQASHKLQATVMVNYMQRAAEASQNDSLGVRLVIRQPMPIRLILGSGSLMLSPIPLWAYLKGDAGEYHLIKTYHGIYQVLVLPLLFAGFAAIGHLFRRDRKQSIPLVFLAVYLLVNLGAVVATSLEQRHLAQFMPAFLILAAVPDTRERQTRTTVWHMAIAWFVVVVFVHLAWAAAK
jgi:hypothetical protein